VAECGRLLACHAVDAPRSNCARGQLSPPPAASAGLRARRCWVCGPHAGLRASARMGSCQHMWPRNSCLVPTQGGGGADAPRRAGSAGAGPAAPADLPAEVGPPPRRPPPLEALRGVPGNHACADCGAPDPDWASLNLGVLLCIQCSGVHRRLGVHVSKARAPRSAALWVPPRARTAAGARARGGGVQPLEPPAHAWVFRMTYFAPGSSSPVLACLHLCCVPCRRGHRSLIPPQGNAFLV